MLSTVTKKAKKKNKQVYILPRAKIDVHSKQIMVIKLISLNVNGIAEKWKQELIFDYLRTLKSDIYYSGGVGVLFCKGLDPNITVNSLSTIDILTILDSIVYNVNISARIHPL
jgi:hypothetical protein